MISARFEKGSRYYLLILEKDLLGDWVIIKVNGRKNSGLGAVRHKAFNSKEEAVRAFLELMNYRVRKRHYHKVACVF